jgi:hypothetical protein
VQREPLDRQARHDRAEWSDGRDDVVDADRHVELSGGE